METTANGISEADLERHVKRAQEIAKAAALPLPGPLREVIDRTPKSILGFTFRKLTLSDWALLQLIDSPVIRIAQAVAAAHETIGPEGMPKLIAETLNAPKSGETPQAAAARLAEDTIQTFYVMTHPAKDARALHDAGKLRQTAMECIGDVLPISEMPNVQESIGMHFANSFLTYVPYEREPMGDGSFQSPQPNRATG